MGVCLLSLKMVSHVEVLIIGCANCYFNLSKWLHSVVFFLYVLNFVY